MRQRKSHKQLQKLNGNTTKPVEKPGGADDHLQSYRDLRKVMETGEMESAKTFDQAILALSGGALGISFTFVEQIAPTPEQTELLGWAWAAFGASLLLTLSSFLVAQVAMRRAQIIIDRLLHGDDAAHKERNIGSTTTLVMNWLSLFCFIAGIGFLGSFIYVNLK